MYGGLAARPIYMEVYSNNSRLFIGDWYISSKTGLDSVVRPNNQTELDMDLWNDEAYVTEVMRAFEQALSNKDNLKTYLAW